MTESAEGEQSSYPRDEQGLPEPTSAVYYAYCRCPTDNGDLPLGVTGNTSHSG